MSLMSDCFFSHNVENFLLEKRIKQLENFFYASTNFISRNQKFFEDRIANEKSFSLFLLFSLNECA